MNKKSSSMVNMPAPREPINQKIDIWRKCGFRRTALYYGEP